MLAYFVIVPILTAVFLYVFSTARAARVIAAAAQAALTGFAAYLFFLCKGGDIVTHLGGYDGALGISLRADTLSSVFIALTAFIFLIATIYSLNEKGGKLFWLLLFIWEGLLIGTFLTRDLFNAFVLLEVSTVAVSILIMFNRDTRSMYDGMLYLMASIVAMQFYLFGVGYIYKLTGVLDMDAAASALSAMDAQSQILPFALVMTAVGFKCAIVPLHSWLPRAHGTPGAPPAVSALLSGIHIKSGVYLFMRFRSIFGEIDVGRFFLVVGIITGIVGFIFAVLQTDIKLILAYHTVSQVGMIIAGLNMGAVYSYVGGLYHSINHALFKSALFLSAGVIVQAYGTRDVNSIRGVLRRFPLVGAATIMAILGITGAPLFNGSISKYFIMSDTSPAVSASLLFINLGTIISFIKYSAILFRGGGRVVGGGGAASGAADGGGAASGGGIADGSSAKIGAVGGASSVIATSEDKVDMSKQVAILALGALCFVGGIFGEYIIEFLFNVKVSVDAAGYLQKVAFFAASGFAGFFIYKYFVNKSPLLKRIRALDAGFRAICVCMGVFFALLLVAAGIFAI
ncbi:MAG: proton-conducting membrane transporter [Oscillospiraceae bacterium]|nr:proton-conducting membrane transporter [Oscillospiraceae bacterium]